VADWTGGLKVINVSSLTSPTCQEMAKLHLWLMGLV